ncbi:YceI family protein [Chitinophaga sp. S165]|uniref:YceI family protein n=1 Tax=Chitinophaga sp. S165 TaxID=2135462 RepID=UPI000D70D91A|nr:YceI family protein [Chitinophaga sp. S165]PWV51967.1 YceI-like domain-containing protein [Chitinophaga sp. S165]
MKTLCKTIALLFLTHQLTTTTIAQQKNDFTLTINGTSTMHDWEMKTSKIACNATFTFYEDGELGGLTLLNFTMPSESLKSERTGLDAVAYKALKTSKYPTITFNLKSATVSKQGTVIICTGDLTVAGVTRTIDIAGATQVNADKSINVKGSKQINMRDFDIDPPAFLFGQFTTGEDVTISFNLTFRH